MKYFGFSIWHGLFQGQGDWLSAIGLNNADFDEVSTWDALFESSSSVLSGSGLEDYGLCLHWSPLMPEMLENFPELLDAMRASEAKLQNLQMGLHCHFSPEDLPLHGNYPDVLERDAYHASLLGAKVIVAHPPPVSFDYTEDLIELLASPPVQDIFDEYDFFLAWENMPRNNFFSNPANIVDFRERLVSELPHMADRTRFCLDTGHLLTWVQSCGLSEEDALREANDALPLFGEYLHTYHLHTNDGTSDHHHIPFDRKNASHESRRGMNVEKAMANSEIILDWVALCEENSKIREPHIHVEALNLPFNLEQIAEFGELLANRLGS